MRMMRSGFVGCLVTLALCATARPAQSQAWLPAKGEGSISVLFTNVLSKDHYLPDKRFDRGHIDANTVLFDVTYGIADRVAVSAGLPLVVSRYRGNVPHRPITLDDGAWHTTSQDFRFGLRYNAMRGPMLVTPFIATELPSREYEFYAHAAPGRRLRELHTGVSAGRLFAELGLVVQGRYAFAVSEGALNFARRYSTTSVEAAYFLTPSVRLIALTSSRIGHTGIDLSSSGRGTLSEEQFFHHDRISRERYTNIGGGFAVTLNDSVDLFASYTTTVAGRNTHAVNRGVSLGVSWSFRPGESRALSARNDREGRLIRCVCQKAAD